jgi:hypothetical protein
VAPKGITTILSDPPLHLKDARQEPSILHAAYALWTMPLQTLLSELICFSAAERLE